MGGYSDYVGLGVDEDIKRFYSKGHVVSVLGVKEFRIERREESEALGLDRMRGSCGNVVLANGLIPPIERLPSMRAIGTAARITIVSRSIWFIPSRSKGSVRGQAHYTII